MFILMVVVFVLGYGMIIFEHVNKVNKAATALVLGVLTWTVYVIGGQEILSLGFSSSWDLFSSNGAAHVDHGNVNTFITNHELHVHLADIAEIILFLLGAMTIVEVIDSYQGFRIITERIKTTNKRKLLWIISILTFVLSALLDNLTTTIVMVALMRKILTNKHNRWLFAGMIIISANSGGAWSPIGDITTIMLWIGGQITAGSIIQSIFLPSLISMIIPLIIFSFIIKGNIQNPELDIDETREYVPCKERYTILFLGVVGLISVPIFKTVTHLPPFMGMLLTLGIIWLYTDLKLSKKRTEDRRKLSVARIIREVDTPTILFFLGILSAVAALQSAGHLDILSNWLAAEISNIYSLNIFIGLFSSIIDNVPLVAASIGMYPVEPASTMGYAANFIQDGTFWSFLAYCAGTGGSVLIIGSAAGVAAMGLEKINFVWYLKHISWIALAGYLAGALSYWLIVNVI